MPETVICTYEDWKAGQTDFRIYGAIYLVFEILRRHVSPKCFLIRISRIYCIYRINKMFDLTNAVRGFKNEGWENYRQMLLNNYPQKDAEENFNHAAKQAYIAFSQAIAAAFEEVDSTPIEGFDPAALDKILGLREKGLRSCVILTLGYRDSDNDWLANLKKVRKSREDFVSEID